MLFLDHPSFLVTIRAKCLFCNIKIVDFENGKTLLRDSENGNSVFENGKNNTAWDELGASLEDCWIASRKPRTLGACLGALGTWRTVG